MLRLPSVQREYDEYWSGDPAFHQPADGAKIKRARETGDWSGLVIDGQQPTKFIMRPVRGEQWRWIIDESNRTDEYKMGPATMWSLMFRCAFVSVSNLGVDDLPSKPVHHKHLGKIAPIDIVNVLDSIDPGIVTELAAAAFERSQTLSPL